MFQLFTDEEILNREFRVKIIKEIKGSENRERKALSIQRYELFRDKTLKYVLKRLKEQGFLADTIKQMKARGSNISIFKKIIKKIFK